jgi:hypothetical protein
VSDRWNRDDVKLAARGREVEILTAVAGIPSDKLDGRHHSCPFCLKGTDCFSLVDEDAGAVLCRKCFANKNGDFLDAIKKGQNCSFPEAVALAGKYLGVAPLNGDSNGRHEDAMEAVCRSKRISVASAIAYGARMGDGTVVFPSWGPSGEEFAKFTIWATGTDIQRKGKWPKGSKGKCGLFLPSDAGKARLPATGETWLVFEGPKDPCAAHALGYLAVGLNTCRMAQRFVKLFRGVHVVLVPDRDSGGVSGAEDAARKLYGVAASVRIAALPAEVKEKSGADFRDVLAKENGESLVREAIEQAAEWQLPDSEGVDNRPRIHNHQREHQVADEAIKALASLPRLYQRGGNLVSVVQDPKPPEGIIRPQGALYLAPVDEPGMCDRLSQAAQFYVVKETDEGPEEVDILPPLRIAKIVRSRQHWPGVPAVEGIIHGPAFLADGSVLTTSGYDHQTGLYLAGNAEFPTIHESPTLADARRARDELLEIVCDFPFATAAHQAAWFALMLTPAARFAFDGPTPLGAFDSNVRGSGKSKLADSIGMVHLGTELPRTAAPANDEEFRKRITAVLLGGELLMLIDNVAGMIGWPSFDALLTGTSWTDRHLGLSKMTGRLAATTQWLASGNNLVFSADTSRRSLVSRLESKEENPEERSGFRHPNLLEWVRRERARLSVAAVTILRAYHVAGRPRMGVREWGSFEGWSNLVRNAVVWVGMDDPGATRQEVRDQSDREAGLLRQLLAAWESADPAGFGLTVQEAIGKAAEGNQLLQGVFAELSTPGKPPSSRSIGMKLHHVKGRVAAGRWFERHPGPGHSVLWKVATATEDGDSVHGTNGTEGTNPNPSYAPARTSAHARTHASETEPLETSPLTTASPTCDQPAHTDCDHPAHTDINQAREWPSLWACPKCEATVKRKEHAATA